MNRVFPRLLEKSSAGQAGIESLVLGASLLVIIATAYFVSSQVIGQSIEQQKADIALTKLKNAVQDVYAAGAGNTRVVEIELPISTAAIEAKGNILKLSLTALGGGTTDFIAVFPTNVEGIIPMLRGRQLLTLQTMPNGDVSIYSGLLLYPARVSETIIKGSSKKVVFSLINYSNQRITGSYCWIEGSDLNAWTTLQGPSGDIELLENRDFNAIFNIPVGAATATYVGTLKCNNLQARLVSSSLTVNVTPFDETPPDPITGLQAVDLTTCGKAVLSWNQSTAPDFNNYNVYQSLSHITNVTSLPVAKQLSLITDTNTQLTGLTDNVRQYFAVTAVDASGNENKTTIYDANAVPTCILKANFWARFIGSFGASTSKILGAPDNIFDATDLNVLGGFSFDVSSLSGSIRNVRMFWSHEIPSKYRNVLETTVNDFNDGSFYLTRVYGVSDGNIGLRQALFDNNQTSLADFNAGTKNNVTVTSTAGGEIVLAWFGGTLVIAQSGTGSLTIGRNSSNLYAGQSFKATGNQITGARLYVRKSGSPSGDMNVELRTDYPTAGIVLASKNLPASSIGTSYAWVDFNFASPVTVTEDNNYFIKVTTPSTSSSNYYLWQTNTANPYAFGIAYQNTTGQSGSDALVNVYFPLKRRSNGYFISTALDANSTADWNSLVFNASKPANTDINVQLSTSDNNSAWSSWGTAYTGIGSPNAVSEPDSRYLRYRVNFSKTDANSTAEFRDINIAYFKGYYSQGDYNSNAIDLNNNVNMASIDWNRVLNGQSLLFKYRLRQDANAVWGNWSNDFNSSPITVSQVARYIQYNAVFQGDSNKTAYLTDVNIQYNNSLVDDYVKLNYGLIDYNDLTAKDYNSTNTPADKMDANVSLIEVIDVNKSRPGGGLWQWQDFNNLKVGGRYYRAGSADSEWRLDAVGIEITYSPP